MNGKYFVGKKVSSFEAYHPEDPITGVRLTVDQSNAYFAGDMDGNVWEMHCPYGTQQMANNILSSLRGQVYKGFEAQDAVLSPEAELGDGITINGLYSVLGYRKVDFGPGHFSTVSAPGDNEPDEEYKYLGQKDRDEQYSRADTYSYIEKTSEEIKLGVKNDLEQQSTEFSIELGKVQTTIEDRINGLSTSITADLDGIRTRVEKTENGIDTINTSISEIEQTADRISTRVEKTEQGIEGLTTSVSTIEQTAEKISTRVEKTEQGIDGLTTDVSEIEQYAKSIRLSVTNGTDSSSFQLTAGAAVLSSGSIKFSGMVTFTDLTSNGNTKINGDYITTGTISASRIDLSSYSTTTNVKSLISSAIDGIELSVTNGTSSSSFKLTSGTTTLSSGEIKITGMVTFSDLKSNSKTVINGDYITTGTISADRIDVSDLKFKTLWGSDTKKAIVCSGSYIYVGGDTSTASYDNVYLYGKRIQMSSWSSGSPSLIFYFDTSSSIKGLVPGTKGIYDIGTDGNYFGDIHGTSLVCHGSTYVTINQNSVIASTSTGSSIGSSTLNWGNGYFKNLYINNTKFDPSSISVSELKSGSYTVKIDTSGNVLPGNATGYKLGSTTYPFNTAYFNNLYVRTGSIQLGSSGGSYGGAKLGFFGKAPIAQISVSYTTITDSNVKTVVAAILTALKNYGLVS